jgi:acetyl esterase/lipase
VRFHLYSLLALGAAICAGSAPAQAQGPADVKMTPIATPSDPAAFPLYPGVAPGSEGATQTERWDAVELQHDRIVRNVVAPTLTPVLPAPGKATGAAVIVAPGGGFMLLSMDNEGYRVAHWLAGHGIAAFVLKYRVNPTPADEAEMQAVGARMFAPRPPGTERPLPKAYPFAIADGEEALRIVRRRAAEWGVDPRRVGMVGFSAGAMTVLQVALDNKPDARPDFFATIYGPMTTVAVPPNAPPLFVAHAADDPLIGMSFGLIEAWSQAGAPVEVHVYEHGGHGFGALPHGTTSDLWMDQFYTWMKDRGTLSPAS